MFKIILQAALISLLASPTFAQDWVVTRVRGTAEQLSGGRWVELVRGAVVLDEQSIRTGPDGRVGLARGAETIELDPGTALRLHEGTGKTTSVEQASGVILFDVERRNVQHFSVQTPFLAAVVKGTKFRVSVSATTAEVEVERGTVQVQDTLNDLVVDIVRGQQAQVSRADPLLVSGSGLIAVFNFDGQRIVNGTVDTPADNGGQSVNADNGGASTQSSKTSAGGNNVSSSKTASGKFDASDDIGHANNNGNGKGNRGGNGTGNNGNGNNEKGPAGSGSANGNAASANSGNGGGNGSGNNSNGHGNNGNNGNMGGNESAGSGNASSGNGNGGNNGHGGGSDNGNSGNGNGNGNGNGGGNGNKGGNDNASSGNGNGASNGNNGHGGSSDNGSGGNGGGNGNDNGGGNGSRGDSGNGKK